MSRLQSIVSVACVLGMGLSASARQASDSDRAPTPQTGSPLRVLVTPNHPNSPIGASSALGTLIQGPYNVQAAITAPPTPGAAWNRLLGCANAWGYYWVSGGAGTTGAFMIHQFSQTGAYIQSFVQDVSNSASTIWGARDLAVDEPNFKLWGGMENDQLKEYTFNPGAGANGTLTFTTSYSLPTGLGITRALARNPANGHFFSKNYNTNLIEYTINPLTVINSFPANTKLTYGLAWDPISSMLWQFDQNGAGVNFDVVEFNQVDPTTGILTGVTFNGMQYGVAGNNIAGGCDIFDDGGGTLKILALHQNVSDELYVYDLGVTTTAPPTAYCTAGTTLNNCLASISATGSTSVSNASGFMVNVTSVEGQKQGIIFYGTSVAIASPWGTSSSLLCVKAPTQRTGVQSSGGTLNQCDGSLSLDLFSYLSSHPTALGNPFSAGDIAYFQGWFRDQGSSKTTSLSNGLKVTFTP